MLIFATFIFFLSDLKHYVDMYYFLRDLKIKRK